jgi:selenium metabolism protein YedF
MSGKAFIIQSEGLGRGDDKLGKLLMANFLRLLGEPGIKPAEILFWNAGVKLLTENSPVLEHVKKLAEQGVGIRACTTCLEYYDLEEKIRVGEKSTMGAAIETMMSRDVITL